MFLNVNEEIKRLVERNPELRKEIEGVRNYLERIQIEHGWPLFGTVCDNRDPLQKHRVKVKSELLRPGGGTTDWIPVLAVGASKDSGWWQPPDIGAQVVMFFVGKGRSRPVVVGCIYDLNNRPPKHSTKNPADSLVYQTRAHRMEFIDEEGKESVVISTAKGQIRIEISKKDGILLKNELGDIKIKCKKFKASGDEKVQIEGKKSVKIRCKNMKVQSGSTRIKSGGEVKFTSRNIKLQGSRGVTAEKRQMAAAQNNVMGFDIHEMVVPSGSGTAIMMLPHPFLGKLADKLSDDVKINGNNAATEGSVARHDNPVHNQLPGTIRFNRNPNNEGEVTGGTVRSVKINGKEAAVIGSTVTTCNDVGARENSTIMAVGAHIPMPVIIHPKNTAAWQEERREKNPRNPEFTSVQWPKAKAKEGEKVELSACVNDIADGNAVTFRIWRRGQDPNSHVPMWQVTAVVENGVAKVPFEYIHPAGADFPEGDPGFFGTAHCAWCQYKRGDEITVELLRHEITTAEWKKDGGGIGEVHIDEEVTLYCEVKDINDGERILFRIFERGEERDSLVAEVFGAVKDGKVEAPWPVACRLGRGSVVAKEIAERGWSEPEYYFTTEYGRAQSKRSGTLEVKGQIDYQLVSDKTDEQQIDQQYTILTREGEAISGKTDESGYIKLDSLKIADVIIISKGE